MLRRLTEKERATQLVATWEPELRRAWLAAIDGIRNGVVLRVIVERLERGDVDGAVRVMRLDREAFSEFEIAIESAFNAGGTAAAEGMILAEPEGHRVQFRFGVRNPEAERFIREHSALLVTGITEDMRAGIRTALIEGMVRGENPRTSALSIVGRVSRVTGKREGGLMGITSSQMAAVERARAELLSGDPAQLRAYLQRGRRDKRFDKAVMRAISTETTLGRADVDRAVSRYSDRLLALRGALLARSEVMTALNGSKSEAMRQAIASGRVDVRDVTKVWRATHDGRTRFTHRVLHGQSVGFDDGFVSPSGAVLRYPGDPSAPASEHVGCRCVCEYKIDHTAALIRRRAA